MKGWAVYHPDYNGAIFIHAHTRSKARYAVWLRAHQVIPSIQLVDLEVKREARLDGIAIGFATLSQIQADDPCQQACSCWRCRAARGEI